MLFYDIFVSRCLYAGLWAFVRGSRVVRRMSAKCSNDSYFYDSLFHMLRTYQRKQAGSIPAQLNNRRKVKA